MFVIAIIFLRLNKATSAVLSFTVEFIFILVMTNNNEAENITVKKLCLQLKILENLSIDPLVSYYSAKPFIIYSSNTRNN